MGLALLPIISKQAGRCMDCGIPFCHSGCPLGNLIPEWNDLVWRNDWREAIERLHATNNFPEFTGRLCPAPCEPACVLGINQEPVTIKNVEVSIIDRAWSEGWVTPQPPERLSSKTVAVVGSGPAGLAAAQQLTRAGHTVAVFERADRIGGLLRYGIPEFKMEKRYLDRRLRQMKAEGTKFRPGVDVGVDITVEQLQKRYDAIVIAVGATLARELPVPGRDLAGIHQAMEYLPYGNKVCEGDLEVSPITAEGLDVVIIGGGDTGADCLGTAHRQGARERDAAGDHAAAAGRTAVHAAVADVPDDHADGQRPRGGRRARLRGQHARVPRRPRPVGCARCGSPRSSSSTAGSPRSRARRGSSRPISSCWRWASSGRSRAPCSRAWAWPTTTAATSSRDESYLSSVPGVFVAGDAGRGQSLIVWAIAEGRACAAAVDRFLTGHTTLPAPIPPSARPLVV